MIDISDQFIVKHGWAKTSLGLSGIDADIFCLIYGFTQDGEHWFRGTNAYINAWTDASRPTITASLKRLLEKNYIFKKIEVIDGVSFNRYRVNLDVCPHAKLNKPGLQETCGDCKNLAGGLKESCTNNIVNNNNTHINDINIIDTRDSAHTSEKSSSSLLDVDRKPKKTTRKTQQDKSKAFIEDCSKLLREFKFAGVIEEKLMEFFTMLSEIGKFLPTTSIKAQLDVLAYMDIDQQKEIITTTITRGWSSLDYAKAEYDKKHHASFDTAQPGTFQPRIPGSKATEELEQKMRDSFNDPERRKKEWF